MAAPQALTAPRSLTTSAGKVETTGSFDLHMSSSAEDPHRPWVRTFLGSALVPLLGERRHRRRVRRRSGSPAAPVAPAAAHLAAARRAALGPSGRPRSGPPRRPAEPARAQCRARPRHPPARCQGGSCRERRPTAPRARGLYGPFRPSGSVPGFPAHASPTTSPHRETWPLRPRSRRAATRRFRPPAHPSGRRLRRTPHGGLTTCPGSTGGGPYTTATRPRPRSFTTCAASPRPPVPPPR